MRRISVRNLKWQGFSNALIAHKLSAGVRSVERDLAWWRESYAETCRNIFVPELVGETLSTYSEIEGFALARANETAENSETAKLLAVALKARKEMVQFLFKLG